MPLLYASPRAPAKAEGPQWKGEVPKHPPHPSESLCRADSGHVQDTGIRCLLQQDHCSLLRAGPGRHVSPPQPRITPCDYMLIWAFLWS